MSECPAITNQTEDKRHVSVHHGGVVIQDGVNYAITADGGHLVPIPEELASKISLALRVQDKIDTGMYPRLASLVSLLNCRKTALVAGGGDLSLRDAIHNCKDIHGVAELYKDVQRLQEQGHRAIRVPHIMEDLETALEEYRGSFPCVVHVFEVDRDSKCYEVLQASLNTHAHIDVPILKKLHRIHSFIVLGQDEEYICFQKKVQI